MRHLERLAASGAPPSGRDRLQSFLTLAGSSPYLGRLLVQNPSFLDTLPAGGSARAPRTREDLEEDHEFLLKGEVFTEDNIRLWIDYKMEREVNPMRLRPHPYEFALYFDI